MTMDFKLPPTGVPGNVKAGDRVAFEFFIDPEGLPQLTSVAPLGSASKGAAAPATGAKP
jgi:Cu(I)/Ag(I) efflux system membrane fusion protein